MQRSATARLIVMIGLTALLLMPTAWLLALVHERAARRDGAVADVSATWGRPQLLSGVVLTVPYLRSTFDASGRPEQTLAFAHILPAELGIDVDLQTETRRRSIFEVIVYRADARVHGVFRLNELGWPRSAVDHMNWNDAVVSVGLSDPRALTRRAALTWRGREQPFGPGVPEVGLFTEGVHARLSEPTAPDANVEIPFSFTLSFNGTREIRFLPAAGETTVTVRSRWPHPSFAGGLPEQRDTGSEGFTAHWQVPDFGRGFPAQWTSVDLRAKPVFDQARASAFGVDLIEAVDIYQQSERAVKYAALFIVLTFVVFFLWDITHALMLHPVQYGLVGAALCVFYLLLVSISEHAGFDLAYGLAAGAATLLIGGYARAVLGGLRAALSVVALLSALYGVLYLLLRLEDYALLAGSVCVLLILAVLMYVTRGMNWYELKFEKPPVPERLP